MSNGEKRPPKLPSVIHRINNLQEKIEEYDAIIAEFQEYTVHMQHRLETLLQRIRYYEKEIEEMLPHVKNLDRGWRTGLVDKGKLSEAKNRFANTKAQLKEEKELYAKERAEYDAEVAKAREAREKKEYCEAEIKRLQSNPQAQ